MSALAGISAQTNGRETLYIELTSAGVTALAMQNSDKQVCCLVHSASLLGLLLSQR